MAAVITSATNRRILAAHRLRQRRHRDREGRFLIDGPRSLERAYAVGFEIEDIFGEPGTDPGWGQFHEIGGAALDKLAYGDRGSGPIAVAITPDLHLEGLIHGDQAFLLVVSGLEKPGNLGAILRTADAVGVEGVIIADLRADPFNPNVIRASTGAVFSIPMAVSDGDTTRVWLKERSIDTLVTSPDGPISLWEVDLPPAVAVVVGAEDRGLAPVWMEHATEVVSIPMRGTVDSLNASVSAALALYEVARRRNR